MTMNVNTQCEATFTTKATSTSLLSMVRNSIAARHQRAALAKLDDVALCDMGLTRAQASAEAARPIWDVPANWRA